MGLDRGVIDAPTTTRWSAAGPTIALDDVDRFRKVRRHRRPGRLLLPFDVFPDAGVRYRFWPRGSGTAPFDGRDPSRSPRPAMSRRRRRSGWQRDTAAQPYATCSRFEALLIVKRRGDLIKAKQRCGRHAGMLRRRSAPHGGGTRQHADAVAERRGGSGRSRTTARAIQFVGEREAGIFIDDERPRRGLRKVGTDRIDLREEAQSRIARELVPHQ